LKAKTELENEKNMSATLQVEPINWNQTLGGIARNPSEIEVACLIRNLDQKNLVAPLREAALANIAPSREAAEKKRRAALALQEQWDGCVAQRELLRNEIKRGKECLEQVQTELAGVRERLEDWADFERICGVNPLPEYMQSLSAKERIEQFLPGWVKRREARLEALERQMERSARENGLEHLL
jgi:hypothetical protein